MNVGPFPSQFHATAGAWWADWLFMLGLLGVGVAVMLGIAMRISAVAGVVMMAMMWLAEFPLAQTTSAGEPSGTTNPLVDYHFMYAVALIVLAAVGAGTIWGLGRGWANLPFVHRRSWARGSCATRVV